MADAKTGKSFIAFILLGLLIQFPGHVQSLKCFECANIKRREPDCTPERRRIAEEKDVKALVQCRVFFKGGKVVGQSMISSDQCSEESLIKSARTILKTYAGSGLPKAKCCQSDFCNDVIEEEVLLEEFGVEMSEIEKQNNVVIEDEIDANANVVDENKDVTLNASEDSDDTDSRDTEQNAQDSDNKYGDKDDHKHNKKDFEEDQEKTSKGDTNRNRNTKNNDEIDEDHSSKQAQNYESERSAPLQNDPGSLDSKGNQICGSSCHFDILALLIVLLVFTEYLL